ncbi:helix-turn-helix domain-containing protein [Liquorilactobacillus capillatus]|uniref:Helix-turn-helix domain-containing protein n=1 Tax=Liquorilactobacillus capillatus DSM 19910 TaxID=1423731 RepID=A0A0R1M4E6_9LACO|nr:helix-turn-helix domain-containing protein [Liquorilactobacillus capillatus]KRL02928.1 hypothetical protein FC81_GL000418 [Liquorilactobacillus capillatus DSM 19910]
MNEFPEVMNLGQAAKFVGVSRNSLYLLIDQGLKVSYIGESIKRVRKQDILDFLAEHQK